MKTCKLDAPNGAAQSVPRTGEARSSDPDTDRRIARSAETALQVTAYLLKNSISTRSSNGLVILGGEVQWEYQRQAAHNAARILPGVVGVRNEIKVRSLAAIIIGRSQAEATRNRHAREQARLVAGKVGTGI